MERNQTRKSASRRGWCHHGTDLSSLLSPRCTFCRLGHHSAKWKRFKAFVCPGGIVSFTMFSQPLVSKWEERQMIWNPTELNSYIVSASSVELVFASYFQEKLLEEEVRRPRWSFHDALHSAFAFVYLQRHCPLLQDKQN